MAVSTPHRHERAKATGVSRNRTAWSTGHGRGTGGRRRGLAGLRDDAPNQTPATRPHWCGGRRRDRRAWPRCRWAAAGPGRASRQRVQPPISITSPTGVEGAGGTGGPGRGARGRRRGLAGLRDDAPSRRLAARTARGRAAAHGHTQQPGPTAHHAAPGTPAAPQRMFHVKHLPNHRPRYPVSPGKWHT